MQVELHSTMTQASCSLHLDKLQTCASLTLPFMYLILHTQSSICPLTYGVSHNPTYTPGEVVVVGSDAHKETICHEDNARVFGEGSSAAHAQPNFLTQ